MNHQSRISILQYPQLSVDASHQRKELSNMSDEELVVACQQHTEEAFEHLLERHRSMIASMLYRLAPDWRDKSDILQEVYIRIWQSIPQLRNPARFKTWVNRIVTHIFFDQLREQPRGYHFVSIDEPTKSWDGSECPAKEIADVHPQPEDDILSEELSSVVMDAIDHIPERFRTAILLRDVGGLSYEEIADATATELGTVKSRIARARSKVQRRISPYLKECA